MMKQDHWKTIFDLKFWERVMGLWVAETQPQVERTLREGRFPEGARILDVACGVGRHSIELARLGHNVVGLDYSEVYLEKAKQAAHKAQVQGELDFVHGDMRNLSKHFAPNGFDAVVMLGNSFGYFDERKDDQRVLKEIFGVLKPGGTLVLDIFNQKAVRYIYTYFLPKSLGANSFDLFFECRPGTFAGMKSGYDAKNRKIWAEWSFFDREHRTFEIDSVAYQYNVYSISQLKAMFKRAGLQMKNRWKVGLDGIRFDEDITFLQTLTLKKPL